MWVYAWSGFCMGTAEDPLRFFAMMYVKDQVLENVFKGTFSDSFWRNLSLHLHCQDIAVNFLPDLELSAFLLRFFYWPCGLKFGYLMINLAFLGIIVKVKLLGKFCLHNFEWFCLQISSNIKYFFLSCPRDCDQGLIVVIVYFKSETRKEHNIHQQCHMGLM